MLKRTLYVAVALALLIRINVVLKCNLDAYDIGNEEEEGEIRI